MNFFIRFFALHFDRSFSNKGWRQLLWLFGIIVGVFAVIFLISLQYPFYTIKQTSQSVGELPNHLSEQLFQLICLFIDPGNLSLVPLSVRWFALVIVILGLVLFCGLLISVISNMLERRVERFREGNIVYPLSNHIIIIGFDDMVPSLIQQLCSEQKYAHCHILIQSAQAATEIRSKIHTELDAKNEKRIIVLHARRNSTEEIEKLYTTKAHEIFIIGEKNEHDHDSLNIECLKKIVDIHKATEACPLIPFTVSFEYQATFAAFQITDLSSGWRNYIEFHPFNFYESWAKKILVNRQYSNGIDKIEYPSLDREPLTYDSEKHIHVVIIGMSRMGVAIGVEAAHLLHFPNFCRDNSKKSVITFIDENADREMNFFCGRYRHYFEISPAFFYDMSGTEIQEQIIPPSRFTDKDSDFLDIKFEFVKGHAENRLIQQKLCEWANAPDEILTIAVCLNYPPQSMAMGLYLPDNIYDNNIPVFIRQETSCALLNMLVSKKTDENSHKYSHILPFGMLDNCYDLDNQSIWSGQAINYVYSYFDSYQTLPIALPCNETLQKKWNELQVSHQWSNLYSAYSIDFKLRSIGISDCQDHQLTDQEIALLAEVEHNRWNMEKLLLGFRKPTSEEEKIINSSKKQRKEYKDKRFVHSDIRPYSELSESSKNFDISITAGIPLIRRNTSCN